MAMHAVCAHTKNDKRRTLHVRRHAHTAAHLPPSRRMAAPVIVASAVVASAIILAANHAALSSIVFGPSLRWPRLCRPSPSRPTAPPRSTIVLGRHCIERRRRRIGRHLCLGRRPRGQPRAPPSPRSSFGRRCVGRRHRGQPRRPAPRSS